MSKRSSTTSTRSRLDGNVMWYMYTGRGITSRASETVRPFLISRWAWACLAGVIRFTVPSWSSWPQRPQLFSSLKYPSTRSRVGSAASAIGRVLSRVWGATWPLEDEAMVRNGGANGSTVGGRWHERATNLENATTPWESECNEGPARPPCARGAKRNRGRARPPSPPAAARPPAVPARRARVGAHRRAPRRPADEPTDPGARDRGHRGPGLQAGDAPDRAGPRAGRRRPAGHHAQEVPRRLDGRPGRARADPLRPPGPPHRNAPGRRPLRLQERGRRARESEGRAVCARAATVVRKAPNFKVYRGKVSRASRPGPWYP